jgi:hypothetical protein
MSSLENTSTCGDHWSTPGASNDSGGHACMQFRVEFEKVQFFEDGTLMRKKFENPFSKRMQYYRGKVISFDPLEGYYLVKYSDGDLEELTEGELMMHLCA